MTGDGNIFANEKVVKILTVLMINFLDLILSKPAGILKTGGNANKA